jgi:superfamily II DNA or RNA helicase
VLDLRFSMVAGRVEVSASENYAERLNFLRSRFASGRSLSGLAFDIDIDDLLVNLNELATWPTDDNDIRWDDALLRLASGNAVDANTLTTLLNETTSKQLVYSPQSNQWKAPLTDFQKRDIAKLLALTHAANFSVPGAGKTRVSLAIYDRRRNEGTVRRMIVVCPKSAFESWQNEAKECFFNPPRVVVMDSAIPPEADIILVNYERLPDSKTALIRWLKAQPALLVLDEAHRMKLGAAGAWGATCLALGPYAAARMILTGTPAPNGAKDLENLFSFVWPGQGRAHVNLALQSGDLRTASAFLRPLYSRTTKKELRLLPVKTTVKRVDLTPLHKDLYRALLGHISNAWRGNSDDIESLGKILLYLLMAATTPALLSVGSSRHEPLPYRIPPLIPNPNSTLNELLRDLPQYELSPKYKEVLRIVGENAKKGLKTLVWSTFVRNLKSLELLLTNYRPAIVHGGSIDRADQLYRFRNDPNCFVLLSNPATLGEGVSLHHECHDAVYVDRDFSAGRFMQSLDRIHRLGLAEGIETRVTVLVSSETIDELVEQRLAKKLEFMGGVLDDPAVIALADLDEDPDAAVGMDDDDLSSLINYVENHANR